MNKKNKQNWKVLIALSFALFYSLWVNPQIALAADESDSWVIPDDSYNKQQEIVEIKGDYVIQQGKHPKGTSSVFYRTTGMYMTLDQITDTYNNDGAFDNVSKEFIKVNQDNETQGSIVITTYTMLKKDFIDAIQGLGVTSQKIKDNNGSITVYIHNQFQLYNPNKTDDPVYNGYSNILGYRDIIDAGDKITGGIGWPDATKDALYYYYNFPYVVTPTIYDVEIQALEKGTQTKLGTLKTGDVGMLGEKYPASGSYTAPETYSVNGVEYKAADAWYCLYTPRGSTTEIRGATYTYTGRKIENYPLPDAAKGTKVKLCFVYERVTAQANIVLNAVDKESPYPIIKSNLDSQNVSAGGTYTQPGTALNMSVNYNSSNYSRTQYYSYQYTSTTGEAKTINGTLSTNGTVFSLNPVPTDVKADTTITVSIYYSKNPSLSIPVTVNAVDSQTGTVIKVHTIATVGSGGTYTYTIPSSDIPYNGKTYKYNGNWEWFYTNTSASKVKKYGTTTSVSFPAPTSDKISGGITVNAMYEPDATQSGEITLRVIMVNNSGVLIHEISTEKVSIGQSISKAIAAQKSVNGTNYSYLNRWAYTYNTATGTATTTGSGTTATFTIAASTKVGTTETLKLYYSTAPIVTVPQAEAPISVTLDSPIPYGVINGDTYSSPYFTSKNGISTTESQYVFMKTKNYLLGYTLVNHTGKVTYNIPVTMHYTLQYKSATPASAGGPKTITEDVVNKQIIPVEKAYSYWEVERLEYYTVGSANVYNYSLPDGKVALSLNGSYYNAPSLTTWHSAYLNDHVIDPPQVTTGIDVFYDTAITSTTSTRPEVEIQDLTSYAIAMTEEAKVRNDLVAFNGSVVLSNELCDMITTDPNTSSFTQTSAIIADKALYTQGKVIDALKINGDYSSNGTVTYALNPNSINASTSSKTFTASVNNVIIHTPVICSPIITADNDKWTQLISPVKGALQIVLDPDTSLNDFTVSISNTLEHSNRLGYHIRDFSRSYIDPTFISYIARKDGIVRNEMKLPFDVYVDIGNDGVKENDEYVKAGTWYVLGRNAFRYYVPMWVKEGTYTAQFRTIAVNGADKLDNTEMTKNSSINNYVATSTKTIQISGRIYGLKIYDISDYPNWESVFREKDTSLFKLFEGAVDGTKQTNYSQGFGYYYAVGTNDQYSKTTGRLNKYTFPLVNGSHPQYKNLGVLKTGYAVRFFLDTTGEMYSSGCKIKIIPTFYYIDKNGDNRQQVDLYYSEEIKNKNYNLLKIGAGMDLVNIKSGITGNIYSRLPKEELKQTANVLNTTLIKITQQRSSMYSYSVIKLLKAFRTFIGLDYAKAITRLDSYNEVKTQTGQTELSLSKYMQRWYGTYKIPTDVHAVPSGYDVYDYLKKHGIDYKENFWLKDGYIIVNFNIVTMDEDGKERLSYINANNYLNNGNCSMWVKEGAIISKKDSKGTTFDFKAGDFMVYYTDKKYIDDYMGKLY